MEEAAKDPREALEPSVLSENQEAETGGEHNASRVSTEKDDEEPKVEDNEAFKDQSRTHAEEEEEEKGGEEEEGEDGQKIITEVHRELTNMKSAAKARDLIRRTELEETRRIRKERLENDAKSRQEKLEEIMGGWSIVEEKSNPEERQEVLNCQRQLCDALIEDKKKLINDLQQELKSANDRYVENLRKNTEELDWMDERMEDQMKRITKTFRDDMAQRTKSHVQEIEIFLTKEKTKWDQLLQELREKEPERLMERKRKVEENEENIHNVMLDSTNKHISTERQNDARLQPLQRDRELCKGTEMLKSLRDKYQRNQKTVDETTIAQNRKKIISLQTEMKSLKVMCAAQEKEFMERSQYLSEVHKCSIQQYERLQKQVKHLVLTDNRQFEKVWLMQDEKVKQLVMKVLDIDSRICKHLGLAWKWPPMAFMEISGPTQPQKQAPRQCSQETVDVSAGPSLEADIKSTDMEVYIEATAEQSESGAEVEEGKLSMKELKQAMELLCDEAGFLMEGKLLKLLAPLEMKEQADVKVASTLCSLGLEDEDLPELVEFLLKYKQQQRQQTKCFVRLQEVCAGSSGMADVVESTMISELIHPNHVLPALKSFLEQIRRSRESSVHHRSRHDYLASQNTSVDKAYWESMANIISEDTLKLWDAAERKLEEHLSVLTEVADIVSKIEDLKEKNTELRMQLQQKNTTFENVFQ
ncbi:dynein regulatory complex protein 1 isoform X1 [Embiotoca jacksoni]|uniref:dynein regulatory complex protein 1 isoform X1 n=1 Tax=Embiotoca jacksoni TaxID=100190 RepID=UPI003703B498